MAFRLGIDTGGTFTDAVLVDDTKQITNAEKSLTTRFDLSVGIGDVIAKLPQAALADVSMVSLSTTLTTNSVVEDLGAPVCVLLPGYSSEQIKQSGLLEILPAQMVVRLDGGYDAVGKEHSPLDEAAAQEAIEKLKEQVSAFAISSMFGIRNASHEMRLKQLVTELTGMPVICGHELASNLGAPRRALTAALNARMVPPIKELIGSVQKILKRHRIDAPLMLVKGDGSLASLANAIEKPIGTVLSGPAASVIGASISWRARIFCTEPINSLIGGTMRAFSAAVSARLGAPRLEASSCPQMTGMPVNSVTIFLSRTSWLELRVPNMLEIAKAETWSLSFSMASCAAVSSSGECSLPTAS